ncbi:hypothetical protein ACOALA_13410 [Alicyclobacillus acidoterrestris]|uniref:DUF4376 domain-containing protein n=1 Tax=Alicyclobacillus acidoterrestris TaxID=1450 RepID=UPI003F532F8B
MNYWFLYTTSTGAIYGQPYLGYADEWTNIPDGCAVLGPIDESDPTATDAWQNPSFYTVQNGTLVKTSTSEQLLAQAQQSQLSAIQAGYNATIAAGFTSNATGQSDTYAIDESAYPKWTGILSVIAAGIGPQTVQVKDLAGNTVTLTADQFRAFTLDGFNFLNAQEQQLWTLQNQIKAATTVEAVQSVTWTPGAYTPQPAPAAPSSDTPPTT